MELDVDCEVKRLRVRPGDAVVVKVDSPMTADLAERLRGAFGPALPDGVKMIVMGEGISLSVPSPELAAELEAAA